MQVLDLIFLELNFHPCIFAFLSQQKEKSSTDQADQADHAEVIKKPKTIKVTPAILY